MHYQKVLKMPGSVPHLSVGSSVGADFTWMSIMLPNGTLIGKPFKVIHPDPQSRELATSKIKEAQEMYSFGGRCFFESTGIYHTLLLCFLRNKSPDCAVINPIITKSSTSMNVRKPYNNKFDSEKAARVGLDVSPKASIVPDDIIIDLRNLVRDYYYFKNLQSAIVLEPHAELKVFFPVYLNVFSKVMTQTSLKLLEACPLAANILAVPKDKLVETIRGIARSGEMYAFARYDVICIATKDTAVFGRTLPSSALRIRLYIKIYKEYQAHLDNILEELHQAVGELEGAPDYDHISSIQTLHNAGFLGAVIPIMEMGSSDLLSSPKKPYAYSGLDPGVNDSGKFRGDRVHISKRGSSLARRILHMVAINDLRVDRATRTPANPVIYDYYTCKRVSEKESVAVGAIMHKICNIIFAMFRDNKPSGLITPEEHRKRYAAEYPESVNTVV